MTHYQKIEAETVDDERGKVKVKAVLNTLVDAQEAINSDQFCRDSR